MSTTDLKEEKRKVLFHEATKIQQQHYIESVDWNRWNIKDDIMHLKNYIGCGLYQMPQSISDSGEFIFSEKQLQKIDEMLSQILATCADCKEIDCIFIYNVFILDDNNKNNKTDKDEEKIYETPIIKFKNTEISDCSFLDISGRIYKSWDYYKKKNTLMPCYMILPKDGKYQADYTKLCTEDISYVLIEQQKSPSCNSSIFQRLDYGSCALSYLSFGVGCAAMFTPVAPLVLTASIASGTSCVLYNIGRKIAQISDKIQHKEPVTGKYVAKTCVSLGSEVLSIASMGSSALISKAIAKGNVVTRAASIGHNVVSCSSVAFRVCDLAFDVYSTVNNFTVLSAVHVVVNAFFLYNTVISTQLASTLITEGNTHIIETYKQSLIKKRHRKAFNKKLRTSSQEDVIQRIVKITDKEQLFYTIYSKFGNFTPTVINTSVQMNIDLEEITNLIYTTLTTCSEYTESFLIYLLEIFSDIKTVLKEYSILCIDTLKIMLETVNAAIINMSELISQSEKQKRIMFILSNIWEFLKPELSKYLKNIVEESVSNEQNTSILKKLVDEFLNCNMSTLLEILRETDSQ